MLALRYSWAAISALVAPAAAQPLAVDQVAAGPVRGPAHLAVLGDRSLVVRLGVRVAGGQRLGPGQEPQGPRYRAGLGQSGELAGQVVGGGVMAGALGGLDEVRQHELICELSGTPSVRLAWACSYRPRPSSRMQRA